MMTEMKGWMWRRRGRGGTVDDGLVRQYMNVWLEEMCLSVRGMSGYRLVSSCPICMTCMFLIIC